MSYNSRKSNRPNEYASKSAHSNIINDKEVQEFISKCTFPPIVNEIDLTSLNTSMVNYTDTPPIDRIIAVDGGYSEVILNNDFPSSKIAYFQIGVLLLKLDDLKALKENAFIDTDDIKRLREIERLKFAIPTQGVIFDGEISLTNSIRKAVYNLFNENPQGVPFNEALATLVFETYKLREERVEFYNLSSCPNPHCDEKNIKLTKQNMSSDYKFKCKCSEEIYLIDILRLHEHIDDDTGASGILGYLITTIEQIIIFYYILYFYEKRENWSVLEHLLFIKDGPLSFNGPTARLHKVVRNFINYIDSNVKINLVGLEKSGAFVEHANLIRSKIKPGQVLLLDNSYIRKNIKLGPIDKQEPYGYTSYYSGKLIYKDRNDRMYVVTMPLKNYLLYNNPRPTDYWNLDSILSVVEDLKCDMYDDAIVPIAIANKLVSISAHPSTKILEKFTKEEMK